MDLDVMWTQFVKFRPMLEELYQHYTKSKSEEELNRPKTIDGRPLTDEEAIKAGLADEAVEIPHGHDSEVDALRALAKEKGLEVNQRWGAARLRKKLGLDKDEPVTVRTEALPKDVREDLTEEAAKTEEKERAAAEKEEKKGEE